MVAGSCRIAGLVFAAGSGVALMATEAVSQSSGRAAEAALDEARVASQAGDFQTATAALERLLILNPTLDNIRLELGVLYLRLGATAAASELIRTALAAPDVPPAVRQQAEALLEVADQGNRRFRWAGSVSVGLARDSNANSGPASGSLGPTGTLSPDSTGQPDTSAVVSASAQVRYDPGFQAGHLLAFDTSVYLRSYAERTDLNVNSLSLSPGMDFNLSRAFGTPADLIVRYGLTDVRRDGDRFLRETGPTATLRFAISPRLQVQLQAASLDQDYIPTTRVSANDDRDGRRTSASASLSYGLTPASSVSVTIGRSDKSANEGFEAFGERSVSASYTRLVDVDWIDAGPVAVSLSGRLSDRSYDATDPALGIGRPQEDTARSLSLSVSVPVTRNAALQAEVGVIDQSSNSPIDRYRNSFALLTVNYRF